MCGEEFEESIGNIQYLKDSYERKFKNEEITNYVYNENEAFLSREIIGLKSLLSLIQTFSPEDKTPEELAEAVKNVVQQRLKGYEDPEAVYLIVNKKLEKILRYLKLQSNEAVPKLTKFWTSSND
jgi:hypothetical protein